MYVQSPSSIAIYPPSLPLVSAMFDYLYFSEVQLSPLTFIAPSKHRGFHLALQPRRWATDSGTGACGLWLGQSRGFLPQKKLRRATQSWVFSKISFIYIYSLVCILHFLLLKERSETSREWQFLLSGLIRETSVLTDRKIQNLPQLHTQLDGLGGTWSIFHPARISRYSSFQNVVALI